MLIIGIYNYYIWKREYEQDLILSFELNHNFNQIKLNQESKSGFKDDLSIPLKIVEQIVFGRSPYGADGWSCYFRLLEGKKSAIFIVNKIAANITQIFLIFILILI